MEFTLAEAESIDLAKKKVAEQLTVSLTCIRDYLRYIYTNESETIK